MFRDIFKSKKDQPMAQDNGQPQQPPVAPGGPQPDASAAPKKDPKVLDFGSIADIEAMKFNIDQARNLFLGNIQKQNDRLIVQNDEIIRLLRLATNGPATDPRHVPVDPLQQPPAQGG